MSTIIGGQAGEADFQDGGGQSRVTEYIFSTHLQSWAQTTIYATSVCEAFYKPESTTYQPICL